MQHYAAFLRGVSPMNAKMPELAKAFEGAGFRDVKTLLSSGNVVFAASRGPAGALRRKAEAAMQQHLGKSFLAIVRPIAELQALLDADPFAAYKLSAAHKRVVTFLLDAPAHIPKLPIQLDGAQILAVQGHEVFSAYLPGPKGPVFMSLIERTFGKDLTTRTWDTVRKVANAKDPRPK
jgi:uncharacterized protein (DUF1697 family)